MRFTASIRADGSGARAPRLPGPQQLYERWERQQWSASAIDLRRDREDWAALPRGLAERLSWHLAAFYVGEERVAVELGPLLAAHESPSEAAFVATQQADEARHAQHFDRFFDQVLDAGDSFEQRLLHARERLAPAVRRLVDDELHAAAGRLAGAPRDAAAKVDFVVLYHLIVEGTLALTGQRTLLAFCRRRDLLPGWCEGLRLIARDERRHVAYGTWLLHRKARALPLRERLARRVEALAPLAWEALVPAGARPERFRPLDRSGVEIAETAFGGLARRLRLAGVELAVAR
jgi:ribonucleoside-diphosphate reductase beta chain